MILLQASVTLVQLVLVLRSSQWMVYSIMLLFNYYILYLCIMTRRHNLPLFEVGYWENDRHRHLHACEPKNAHACFVNEVTGATDSSTKNLPP